MKNQTYIQTKNKLSNSQNIVQKNQTNKLTYKCRNKKRTSKCLKKPLNKHTNEKKCTPQKPKIESKSELLVRNPNCWFLKKVPINVNDLYINTYTYSIYFRKNKTDV